jgi:aminobenzoyl-glutamate transport protein
MRKIRRIKEKLELHPIITFCLIILFTVILSGILTIFNVSSSYNSISSNGSYVKELVKVENLFSLSGLKYIFSNAVSNFASFAPLSMLIITLFGIGIMDKSGFLDSLFYVLTKNANKKLVTFILSLVCIISSIGGDLSYVILIPMSALLFKYGKRHPKAGIICAFASISCGIGINIFLSSIDSTLIGYTTQSASLLVKDYQIGTFSYILVMLVAAITLAFINTSITEKIIVPKLGHYEHKTEETEETHLTKKEIRGLLISSFAGIIYLLIFVYNIIPGAPLGGNLLDYSQKLYIDKLFGYNSFFNQGFVFVVVLLFFILGLTYGITTKSIKSQKDLGECLSYSLDKIGSVLVLLFFASTLIFIFKKTNIGSVVTAYFASLINNSNFTGIPLILLLFFASAISTLVLPSSVSKWSILSASIVPVFMNAGISPEETTLIFRAGECATYGLTPIMAYFVIYLAFMELYSTDEHDGVLGNIKYIIPYSLGTTIMWLIIIILFYIIGIPLGIGAYPGL